MTALLFKNWGFPHKVFKGVQTFESKKIKETLQIQRFSHFLILPQTGIQMFITQDCPSSSAKYREMRIHACPCRIQNRRISSSWLDSVSFAAFSWEKNVGVKSIPMFLSFAYSTHL